MQRKTQVEESCRMNQIPRIMIVGGGAAGSELATRLGDSLGKKGLAEINLIDSQRIHLWKPLLHEVASGSLDTGREALSYRAHSAEHDYYFHLGVFSGLNLENQTLELAPLLDHHGKQVLPTRTLSYDYLVLALGSKCNDFGIKGVKRHCFTLDSSAEAEDFHLTLLNRFLQFSETAQPNEKVKVAIVGGGAIGVELAAELYATTDRLEQFGVHKIHHSSLSVTLIEAADRILPVLPEALSNKAHRTLSDLGVDVQTNVLVKDVQANKLITADGEMDADLIVWAAGVKAPDFLKELGLTTNRINQVEITPSLQAKGFDNIFAIGDCGFLMKDDGRPVPPTAQAAHQMAATCAGNIRALVQATPLSDFNYNDHGALVSLSHFQALGNLIDEVMHKNWKVEGRVAHWAYASLYRQHQFALHGFWRTIWTMMVNLLEKRIKPKMKLY